MWHFIPIYIYLVKWLLTQANEHTHFLTMASLCGKKKLKSILLANFHDTLYYQVVLMICIRSLESFILHNFNLVPFNQHLLILPHPPTLSIYLTVLNYTHKVICYLSFCAWLISPIIMSSRFIHVTNDRISFLKIE
jgi:hypothetical protein